MAESHVSWLVSDIQDIMCISGAWNCDVIYIALSSMPRYTLFVLDIISYVLCHYIFDNYRVIYHK